MRAPFSLLLFVTATFFVIGCTDVREFEGEWSGPRVGEAEVLRTGFETNASATLTIDEVDLGRLRGSLTITGSSVDDVFQSAPIQELAGAEADALADLTFTSGQPARVFVTLVPTGDGGGEAVAFISLHREDRVELRVLRQGISPLYGIFFLERP